MLHFYRLNKILIVSLFLMLQSCVKNEKHTIHKNAQTENLPTFLLYGELLPDNYADTKDSLITKSFGFKMVRMAGCLVTKNLTDSIQTINQHNNLLLQSKYGQDWKEKFEQESKLKIEIPGI